MNNQDIKNNNSFEETNSLDLKKIQQGSYQVLKQISDICDKYNWRWFLTYGTLIGAIRDKGIIPWDDDIDIMMPRPDYEKLKKYFSDHESEVIPLKLFEKNSVSNYPHYISRISDQRYHLIFKNEADYNIGLFVDIYPLDGIGNDYQTAVKTIHKTKKLASLCFLTSRKRFSTDNTESKLKMFMKFPAYIWARLMGNSHYINKLENIATRYDYDTSNYVACVGWPAGKKYGRERDIFDRKIFETKLAEFEDSKFPIPIGYDEFLTVTYGDYMTPPSDAGKKVHHDYIAFERESM